MKYFNSLFLLLILLAFTACSDDSSPVDDNKSNNNDYIECTPLTITGTIKDLNFDYTTSKYSLNDWSYGTAKIEIALSVTDILATADVAADGSFSLTLPSKMNNKLMAQLFLLYGIPTNPANLEMTMPILWSVKYTKDGEEYETIVHFKIADTDNLNSNKKLFEFWCFKTDGSINHNTGEVQYNITAKKGWNLIEHTTDDEQVSHYKTITQLPNDVIIYVY